MNEQKKNNRYQSFIKEQIFMGMSLREYMKSLITPFNIAVGLIILIGIGVAFLRYTKGLAAITEGSDDTPWGLFISFNVLCGVALSAGGYTLASAVYLFGMKKYLPLVRPAILSGFIGYFFVVIALLFDIGRPWRLPYPMVYSFGVTSVMFLVAWHVALYLSTQFLEFSPAIFEWLNMRKLRNFVEKLTIGATVFGVILSTLHQSALGALFLLAPTKVHPLWYSQFIPVFFFISSIAAGISIVIFITGLSTRYFRDRLDHHFESNLDELTIGLGKAASIVLFTYFGLIIVGIAHSNTWSYLNSSYGYWYLVEVVGFALIPCFLYIAGVRKKSVSLIRFTSFLTIIGIILNRLNLSLITFNWKLEERMVPPWQEFVMSLTIILLAILTFRWITNRMPVLRQHPDYEYTH